MGVTEGLLRQLQQIGETQIGGGLRSGGSGAAAVMKNSMTFKEWYTSEEGKKSPCFATMRGLVVQAVQRFCAALYERGGRLHAGWKRKALKRKRRRLPSTSGPPDHTHSGTDGGTCSDYCVCRDDL